MAAVGAKQPRYLPSFSVLLGVAVDRGLVSAAPPPRLPQTTKKARRVSDLPAIPIFDSASTSVVTGKSEYPDIIRKWLTFYDRLRVDAECLLSQAKPATNNVG
jgi:hypothetical protein